MLPKKGFRLEAFCVCALYFSCVWTSKCVKSVHVHTLVSACVHVKATCSHKQRNGIGSIQPTMIHCQRDYSLQWHFCKRVDSPSFRFCSVSTKRLHCLKQKELLFPSVSFIEENSAPNRRAQNPVLAALTCEDCRYEATEATNTERDSRSAFRFAVHHLFKDW